MTTTEKIRSALQKEHLLRVRYSVEDAVARTEEFDLITFQDWESSDLDDVTDEASARSAFIDYVVDYVMLGEDLYTRNEDDYSDATFDAYVLDCAADLRLRKE